MRLITRQLVDTIEQFAWLASGGVGDVDTLPDDSEWMEAVADCLDVPPRVVESIVGDMRMHTTPVWQKPQRRV